MEKETMYRRVDVKERTPLKDDVYNTQCGNENTMPRFFFKETQSWSYGDGTKVSHWLEPITGHFLTPEQLREVKGAAFDAGMAYGMDLIKSTDWAEDTTLPDKQTYLDTL